MAFRFKATEGQAPLPPGLYTATLESIEEPEGQKGPYLMWKFAINHEGREVLVNALTSTNCAPKAYARQYAEALLGRAIITGEEIEPEALYGAECQVVLTVVPLDTGGTVNRVERVLPRVEDGTDEDIPF
jgi:hypothetical protein